MQRICGSHIDADGLLDTASGAELLFLMAMSNVSMRQQIRRELDRRAFVVSSCRTAPATVSRRPLGRAA